MPLEELGAYRPRADRIDANVLWGVLRRRILAPVVQGRLAHRVVGVAERLKSAKIITLPKRILGLALCA